MLSSVKGSSVLWDGFVFHATCRVSSSSGAQPKTLGLSTHEPGLAPHKPLKHQHSVSKGGLTNTEDVSHFGSALSVLPLQTVWVCRGSTSRAGSAPGCVASHMESSALAGTGNTHARDAVARHNAASCKGFLYYK